MFFYHFCLCCRDWQRRNFLFFVPFYTHNRFINIWFNGCNSFLKTSIKAFHTIISARNSYIKLIPDLYWKYFWFEPSWKYEICKLCSSANGGFVISFKLNAVEIWLSGTKSKDLNIKFFFDVKSVLIINHLSFQSGQYKLQKKIEIKNNKKKINSCYRDFYPI